MLEEQLKELILSRYRSIRAFSLACDVPYTTVVTVLSKGVNHASIRNIIAMCDVLNISADALAEGEIKERKDPDVNEEELDLVCIYRSLNKLGKDKLTDYANLLLLDSGLKKEDNNTLEA